MITGTHFGSHRFGGFGRRFDSERLSELDQLLAQAEDDRRYRWRSAMVETWTAGDVLVGVTRDLNISVFTARDSTEVADPYELAEALMHADRFARHEAASARRVLTASALSPGSLSACAFSSQASAAASAP
jgi:hypothetical protein